MSVSGALGVDSNLLSEIQNSFSENSKNQLAQFVGTQFSPLDICLDRNVLEKVSHVYRHKVILTPSSSLLGCKLK